MLRQKDRNDCTQEVSGRILIVEDEPEILEPLAHSLQQAGYEVLRAEDGLTACRVIGNEKPDLILLDIMLPNLNGWEVCKLLRQHPDASVASIPVIMLTALDSPHHKYRGLQLGADAYLPKPFSIREVILHTVNLVKRRRETVALESRLRSISRSEKQASDIHHLLFHELRNQLLIINGYSELLNKNPDGHRAQTCRDAIYRSSSYLQTLAEEVLLIRQVEDGKLELHMEPLDLFHLITEIISVYSTPAREKRVKLIQHQSEQPAIFSLDRAAVKIILSSLLDNSIKYGPDGQEISIACHQSADAVELKVTDQGPGVPAQDLPHIFEPYFRSTMHQDKIKGSGIGLNAVSVLAKAMGGYVTAENRPEKGICFRVTLPVPPGESS